MTPSLSLSDLPPPLAAEFDRRCEQYLAAWHNGPGPHLQRVLAGMDGPHYRVLLRHALRLDLELRQRNGQTPEACDYLGRFEADDVVVAVFAEPATVPFAPDLGAERLPCLPGYEVLRLLGRGGMGKVYLARSLQLKRLVALKLVSEGWADGHAFALAQHEAEALGRLNDPQVVTIYDVGEYQGRPYLALEYGSGGSLADRLKGAPQPPRKAAQLVETLALTLHRIHGRDLVHCDLKPANILLLGEPGLPLNQLTPKVSDFGLVKYLNVGEGRSSNGQILGTPSYMAPEQALGENDRVSPATDIYALGAVLYECLTGRPPFRAATTVGTLAQTVNDTPVSPRLLNRALDAGLAYICLKCLAKDPKDRYHSAAELAANLRRWLDGEPVGPTTVWDWLLHPLNRPFREEEYLRRHVWRLRTEAATALTGHVGFFLLLLAGMPGQVLWGWLLLLEISGGWVNWIWGTRQRTLSAMERDILQLWTGAAIANVILLALHCPLWGPVQPLEVVRFYPAWAAVYGLVFFAEGRFCGGWLYLVSALFFAAAVLLPLAGLWSPVAYGLLYSTVFVWFSLVRKDEG
jgi:serine/threonine protein kinase